MVTASLASYVAASSRELYQDISQAKQFYFDADGIAMAHSLSLHDWREYEPMARLPFQTVWLEWTPGDYLPPRAMDDWGTRTLPDGDRVFALETLDGVRGRDRVTRVGMLAKRGGIGDIVVPVNNRIEPSDSRPVVKLGVDTWHAEFFFQVKRGAGLIPWALMSGHAEDAKFQAAPVFNELAWGEPWVAMYGIPFSTRAYLAKAFTSVAATANLAALCSEFAGVPRLGLAALATINAHHELQEYPESYRTGRTAGSKSNSIPAFTPRVIKLRPDAKRYVLERAEREPTGRRVREHGVRGHWRKLPGRKIWVRDHKRGDALLGRVESSYRVEQAPPTLPDD